METRQKSNSVLNNPYLKNLDAATKNPFILQSQPDLHAHKKSLPFEKDSKNKKLKKTAISSSQQTLYQVSSKNQKQAQFEEYFSQRKNMFKRNRYHPSKTNLHNTSTELAETKLFPSRNGSPSGLFPGQQEQQKQANDEEEVAFKIIRREKFQPRGLLGFYSPKKETINA